MNITDFRNAVYLYPNRTDWVDVDVLVDDRWHQLTLNMTENNDEHLANLRDSLLLTPDEIRPYQPAPREQWVAMKVADINTWRDQQEQAPVEHNGHRWDADPTSRARIESVLLAGAMPLDYWTDADNVDRTMTLEQLRALYAAIVQQGGRIHDRQRQMKAEVAALTTIEDVQSYPVGWPIEEPA